MDAANRFRPAVHAAAHPERPATITGDGRVITYAGLEERSARFARSMADRGLRPGDHIAIAPANQPESFDVMWAAQRSGLFFTPVPTRLTPDEAAYIVDDCGARLVAASATYASLAVGLAERTPTVEHRVAMGGDIEGHVRYEDMAAAASSDPLVDEVEGIPMTYSSGTTGRPKGVQRQFLGTPYGAVNPLAPYFSRMGVVEGSVFIVPTPLYHAMSLHWSMALHRIGATCVLMERFDAQECLALIERHQVTHGLFVPTMFVRMLKLSDEERLAHDLSSLQTVIHAAAPCPVDVKRRMLEWWGPKIDEFYGASEGGGATYITGAEWLAHPGSVGRPLVGTPHVCDDDGNELAIGEEGTIWFGDAGTIGFHNDPEASRSVIDHRGWVTFWDVGRVDADGYLYLTDRKQFMIIAGGVNIYPQEIEDILVLHPKVADCAVVGVPNPEYGEEVKAVVQPVHWSDAGPELGEELMDFCRSRLATFKCPRSVDFDAELPRAENGKLYKRQVRDRYWPVTSDGRLV